jgi:hypothetical protein
MHDVCMPLRRGKRAHDSAVASSGRGHQRGPPSPPIRGTQLDIGLGEQNVYGGCMAPRRREDQRRVAVGVRNIHVHAAVGEQELHDICTAGFSRKHHRRMTQLVPSVHADRRQGSSNRRVDMSPSAAACMSGVNSSRGPAFRNVNVQGSAMRGVFPAINSAQKKSAQKKKWPMKHAKCSAE